jgi:heme a synthase
VGLLSFRAGGAAHPPRAAFVLVAVELGQGVVGFVQYALGLPVLAVALHMLGACLAWLATLSLLWATRDRRPATTDAPVSAFAAPAPPVDHGLVVGHKPA